MNEAAHQSGSSTMYGITDVSALGPSLVMFEPRLLGL
jgi:hypothetical protein